MIRGVGVDTVDVVEMERLCADAQGAFVTHTFTVAERAQAFARHRPCERLAGKFAVKEAVFKALAPLTRGGFDLRLVETLEDANGCPHVTTTGPLADVLDEAGASELLVSITNECGLATAFVIAQ
ncbi:holo-ACP synthase [Thermophilibacter immobilis]|uniref:4'-phosphopantetheinyl transferase superfamily protein n=1 Tax=Thermophilibacter immobilis TaxID=2779519 RepID=A0A7S7M7L7_9ACTN|nr:4'-phosphopantetheinyl transferase superfamily protein [Thermophilibacter immobilis]QOY60179.1 4'-phosphopantetheinyl transferase superfamily protein [Thermophilibacter immobilis]